MQELSPADKAKRAAAAAALDWVEDGMKLGLGTGSTAAWMVRLLAERVAQGLDVVGVPTSVETRDLAESLGIRVTTLKELGALDLTLDGADEFDPRLNLIKGGGGALLREKIVAASSVRMVVIADRGKQVETLGKFLLPLEVIRFGWRTTQARVCRALEAAGYRAPAVRRRMGAEGPFFTDQGNYVLDLDLGRIDDPAGLDKSLNAVTGVAETGLFIGLATAVIVGHEDGSAEQIGG